MLYYIGLIDEHLKYPGVAQFGSALPWGGRGRGFKSRHSDQNPEIRFADFRIFIFAGLEASVVNDLPVASQSASRPEPQ